MEASAGDPLSELEAVEVLARVDLKEMTVADAARLIGCSRLQVYQLQRRLATTGSLASPPRRARIPLADREAVIAFALREPTMGARNIAAALAEQDGEEVVISPSTVGSVLQIAGLKTVQDRVAAAARREPPASV